MACLSSILRRVFLMACTVTEPGSGPVPVGITLGSQLWQILSSSLNTSRPNFSFETKPETFTDQ